MTAVTLRPNATAVAPDGVFIVLGGGAGSAHAALNDNSDSTNVTINGSSTADKFFVVDMGTSVLPAGSIVRSITLRTRHDLGVYSAYVTVPSIGTVIGTFFAAGGGMVTSTSSTYAPTVVLSQVQVDGIQVGHQGGGSFSVTTHIVEDYIDLVIALIPVTTATGPTGALSSSNGTAAWTYVQGSDGDVQSKYRVKVYTATEYGGGGFDPDVTAVTVYDSGDVNSAGLSAAISGLPNSSTLRAYIKTAQVINGITMWSAWSFSGFTTSFTTSNVSSVVPTPSNTLAKHTVVVNRNTGTDAWNFVDLQRSIDAGASWVFVRDGNHAAASGTTFTLDDYESSNGTSTLYRARAYSSVTGAVGAWVQSTPANAWTAAADWLKNVNVPAKNRQVNVVVNPVLQRMRPQRVFAVVGRADPIVVSDLRTNPAGDLILVTITDQDAVDLLDLTDTDVLLFQPRPGARIGPKYIAITGITELPVAATYNQAERRWQLSFVEVLAPVDT